LRVVLFVLDFKFFVKFISHYQLPSICLRRLRN
jgi:hypothetical protein